MKTLKRNDLAYLSASELDDLILQHIYRTSGREPLPLTLTLTEEPAELLGRRYPKYSVTVELKPESQQ